MESGESGRVKQQIIWKINRLSRAGSLKADQKLGCLSPSGQLQPDSWNWAMIHPYHPYKDLLFKFEASISIQLQLNSTLIYPLISFVYSPLTHGAHSSTFFLPPPLPFSYLHPPDPPSPYRFLCSSRRDRRDPPAWLAGQSTAAPHGAASGVERCRWEPPARPHGHDLQGRAPPAPRVGMQVGIIMGHWVDPKNW
jgi:hypothetical protein